MDIVMLPTDKREGATALGPDDMEGLRLSYISTRAQLDAAEFDNIASAAEWAQRCARKGPAEVLSVNFLLDLHQRMFGQVWDWAGKWRRRDTNIGVDWIRIPQDVANALADALHWHELSTFTRDEIAVRVHHRLAQIHPFPNGNGRSARYVADLYLMSTGSAPFTWGRDTPGTPSEIRADYIGILQSTDITGDYTSMMDFARS